MTENNPKRTPRVSTPEEKQREQDALSFLLRALRSEPMDPQEKYAREVKSRAVSMVSALLMNDEAILPTLLPNPDEPEALANLAISCAKLAASAMADLCDGDPELVRHYLRTWSELAETGQGGEI